MSATALDSPAGAAATLQEPPDAPARLTERAFLNAAAVTLDHGVKLAVNLVVTPLLVTHLGRSLFGVWQVISKLVHFMAAADGRPTLALKWLVANRSEVEADDVKRRYVGSAIAVWALFLPVLAIAGGVIVWIAPSITHVAPSEHGTVRLTAAIVILDFVLGGLIAVPEAVLRGMNLGYKRMGLVASLSIIGGLLSVWAVLAGYGIVGLAVVNVILSVVTAALFYIIISRCVRWFGIARPDRSEVVGFLRLSGWYFAWTLINTIIMSADVVVLAAIASTSAVTTYVLTGQAAQIWLTAVSLGLGAVTPGLGSLIGRCEYARAARMRGELLQIVWILAVTAGSLLLLWNSSFVRLWVGGSHYAGAWANFLLVLLMTQMCLARADAYIIDATLQMREKVLIGFVGSVLSVALAVSLIPSYGIVGLCLGLLFGRLILSAAYPLLILRQFRLAGALNPAGGIRPAVVTAALYACCSYSGTRMQAGSWLTFVAGGSMSAAFVLFIAFHGGLDSGQRASLKGRIRRIRLREA